LSQKRKRRWRVQPCGQRDVREGIWLRTSLSCSPPIHKTPDASTLKYSPKKSRSAGPYLAGHRAPQRVTPAQATEHSKVALRGPTRKLEIDVTLVEAARYRPPLHGAMPEG